MEKLIITIALTGNVPTKELNKSTPITADEIVADAKACEELGAAVAHIHVRDEIGMPTSDRSLFKQVIDKMDKEKLQLIKQLSTGVRGAENTIECRGQMLDLGIEMASLSTGSSNFPTSINANSPELIKALALKMKKNNIKPEIEIFDTAMLSNAIYYAKKGILNEPLHFNLVMNVKGSMLGTPRNLMFLVDNLPKGSTWTVSGIGRSQVQMITMAIAMGGHVRTGIEDTIEYVKGVPATNKMLVQRVVNIAKAVGRPIATPDEARKLLNLE